MAHSAGFPLFMVTEADRTRSCMWAISRRFSLFLSSSLLRIRVKIRTKFELKNSDEFVRIRGYFLSENGHLAFLFYSPSKEEEKTTCSLSGANAGTEVDRGWRKQASDRRGGGRLARAGGSGKGEHCTADLDHGPSAFAAARGRHATLGGISRNSWAAVCPSFQQPLAHPRGRHAAD